MSNKIPVEIHISMPRSRLGSASMSFAVDPADVAESVGTGKKVTTESLAGYIHKALEKGMVVTLVNGREATKSVREAQRDSETE